MPDDAPTAVPEPPNGSPQNRSRSVILAGELRAIQERLKELGKKLEKLLADNDPDVPRSN
jgi:hypothetical protein